MHNRLYTSLSLDKDRFLFLRNCKIHSAFSSSIFSSFSRHLFSITFCKSFCDFLKKNKITNLFCNGCQHNSSKLKFNSVAVIGLTKAACMSSFFVIFSKNRRKGSSIDHPPSPHVHLCHDSEFDVFKMC